jgi:hypothetical protein
MALKLANHPGSHSQNENRWVLTKPVARRSAVHAETAEERSGRLYFKEIEEADAPAPVFSATR